MRVLARSYVFRPALSAAIGAIVPIVPIATRCSTRLFVAILTIGQSGSCLRISLGTPDPQCSTGPHRAVPRDRLGLDGGSVFVTGLAIGHHDVEIDARVRGRLEDAGQRAGAVGDLGPPKADALDAHGHCGASSSRVLGYPAW